MATDQLFRAIEASYWNAPGEPIIGHYEFMTTHGIGAGRWNDERHYALYTSHEPDTALAEKSKWYRARSWAGATTGTAKRTRLVVISFAAPRLPASKVYDGESQGMLAWPNIADLMRTWDHSEAQRFAAVHFYDHIARAIVPSSPAYQSGAAAWNSVLYVGRGLLAKSDLPNRRRLRKVDERML